MFDKMDFNGQEEEFNKYVKLRVRFLYLQFYNIFLEKKDKVNYNEIKSCIIYDKNLRDKIYVYLATFEELLRATILERYDLRMPLSECKNEKNYISNLARNIYITDNHNSSELYYKLNLDLGDLIKLCEIIKMYDSKTCKELHEIRKLRNNVMHHNVVVLGEARTYSEMSKHRDVVLNRIKVLSRWLPSDYKQGFINEINKISCDVKEYKVEI